MASSATHQSTDLSAIAKLRRQRDEYTRSLAKVEKELVRVSKPRAKFGFYERVLVALPARNHRELLGQWGVVRGRARGRKGRWVYAIRLESTGECVVLSEREFTSSGQFEPPPPVAQRRTIRVRVDARGRGTVVRP